jgi:hypothetical protein
MTSSATTMIYLCLSKICLFRVSRLSKIIALLGIKIMLSQYTDYMDIRVSWLL